MLQIFQLLRFTLNLVSPVFQGALIVSAFSIGVVVNAKLAGWGVLAAVPVASLFPVGMSPFDSGAAVSAVVLRVMRTANP